jgi:hypothetical protein
VDLKFPLYEAVQERYKKKDKSGRRIICREAAYLNNHIQRTVNRAASLYGCLSLM